MVNRREFIKLGAAGGVGLLVGIPIPGHASSSTSELHPLVHVDTTGQITLFAQNPEMGQGVKTALPVIIAEELDVDWNTVKVQQADWDPRLDNQFSGGSLSIRLNYEAMRQAGATARALLLAAAAQQLDLPANRLTTQEGFVIDQSGAHRIGYGALADLASTLPVPEDPELKSTDQFRLIGTSISDVDLQAIVRGEQIYSMDLKRPDMLFAVIVRCPHPDGQPITFDDSEARKVDGVVGIQMLRNTDHGGRILMPNCPNFVSGVAVAATSTYAAMTAAKILEIEWDLPDSGDESNELFRRFEQALEGKLELIRNDGSVDQTPNEHAIDVTYTLPFLAHVPMEPMNCTAHVIGDSVHLWAPTQNPAMAAEAAAKVLGIAQENVKVHVMRCGGAFGRRYYADFVIDTVLLSKHFNRPVKVVWTREDDIRYDYFRSASKQRVRAALDKNSAVSHWHHQVASHSRMTYLERDGSPSEIDNYEFPAGFVPNLLYEYASVPARVALGQWRAVAHSSNVFVVSSAIDELAHAAGIDTIQLWLRLVGEEQFVQVREGFRFDASRLKQVIVRAAKESEWGSPLPKGKGRGFAASYNQGAWVAEVAEVTVKDDTITVDRITCVVDCGQIINPQGAENQVEGGIIEGLSATLYGQVTVKDGKIEQSNFHDYRLCRIHEMPAIDIHFIPADDAPRGLGEGPLPPVAPAVCNAIFAATGKRIRSLPINPLIT